MAFDGSVVCALVNELNNELAGGGISKIIQPEKDELLLTIKKDGVTKRLFISVNPSLPAAYLAEQNITAPLNAPAFCMFLRKHIQGGRIISVSQPSLERIIDIEIEHYDEMGDLKRKVLTAELMGKHSNIIFRSEDRILDSIKHVSSLVSSVREVLPGRDYFVPFADSKCDPFTIEKNEFISKVFGENQKLSKAIYTNITGFSPDLAEEIAYMAGLDSDRMTCDMTPAEQAAVYDAFAAIRSRLSAKDFHPHIVINNGRPESFGVLELSINAGLEREDCSSVSEMLIRFYSKRQFYTVMRQKTADLRQITQNLLAKNYKKYDLQLKQLKDTEKRDKYKVYGELLTAYGYSVEPKSTSFKTVNFYTNEEVTIPLDPELSAIDNGKNYYEKYSKLKRTYIALTEIISQTESEIAHLESISLSIDNARNEADISDIKNEMTECGYIKSKGTHKTAKAVKSLPMHFISSDGYDIYVGKNNYQNEYISFKMADNDDWWFHAKNIPGSHVILKCAGKEVSDKAFEEAASLAAHFSKANENDKVEIDYIQKKFLKKPPKAMPGFVIYHKNYSMYASTDISGITEVSPS
ncbi:MAG: NFACT family protein [Lachnospiraceae bacterium]|nr:NFACT family protein [Lachnospiraceae bacterium]